MNEKKWAIIVAAGRGSRFGGEIPKQFVLLNERPVIAYSMEVFFRLQYQLVVVLHPDDVSYFQHLAQAYQLPPYHVAMGGEQRFHSVQNALALIPADDATIVAVHDAARPNIDSKFLQQLENEAIGKGNAIPALAVHDSLRMKSGAQWVAVQRDNFRIIQTPQYFRSSILKKAYQQSYTSLFTDDASVLESLGVSIHLVNGKWGNIKITQGPDLDWMSHLISSQEKNEQ